MTLSHEATRHCGGCGQRLGTPFFESRNTPVDCGYAPDNRDLAKACRMGEIALACCHRCGLIQNAAFNPSLIKFEPGYEVELTHSNVFESFQNQLVERLINEYSLRSKHILEIGCGSGRFLHKICDLGANTGVGIDPSVNSQGEFQAGEGSYQLVESYFPAYSVTSAQYDFVCSLSVIEDIPDFREFLGAVHDLTFPTQTPIYFEVFNGLGAFERNEVWSIHYEQCNYFSLNSLCNVLRFNGFEIKKSGVCYEGDQYLYAEVIPVNKSVLPPLYPIANDINMTRQFRASHQLQQHTWNRRVDDLVRNNQNAVVWGSGGKGISFLNQLNNTKAIEAVIDINPNRQNRFIPGTGHPILAPEALAQIQPQHLWVTNRIYLNEIKRAVEQLCLSPQFDVI